MINNQEKNQWIETDPELLQMLELAVKGFKIVIKTVSHLMKQLSRPSGEA